MSKIVLIVVACLAILLPIWDLRVSQPEPPTGTSRTTPGYAWGQLLGGKDVQGPQLFPGVQKDETWRANQRATIRKLHRENPGRVFSGEVVLDDEEQYWDCVSILDANSKFKCTGVLIGSNMVLTAGHAFSKAKADGGLSKVYFGFNAKEPQEGDIVAVKTAILHCNYSRKKVPIPGDPDMRELTIFFDDITLLVLDKKAPEKASPRAIATTADIKAAKSIVVVGFGANKVDEIGTFTGEGIKRRGEIAIATHSCERKKNNMDPIDDEEYYGCCRSKELVAASADKIDSCSGDSGGPAYVVIGNRHYVAGLVSRPTMQTFIGDCKLLCGDGGCYVRVDQYKEWIEQQAKKHGGNFN